MNVREALANVFEVAIGPKRVWRHDPVTSKFGLAELNQEEVRSTDFMDSLAGDRNLLASNFGSEVMFIDHIGIVGLMGFKMRNNRIALFYFNGPTSIRTLERVERKGTIEEFNRFKKSIKENHNIKSDELETWLALKLVSGVRLK